MDVKIVGESDHDNVTRYITKYRNGSDKDKKKKKKVWSDSYLEALIKHREEVDYLISKVKARNARIAEEEADTEED